MITILCYRTQTVKEINYSKLNKDKSGSNVLHEMEIEQMPLTLKNNDSQNALDDDNNWYETSYTTEESIISYALDGRRIVDLKYFFRKTSKHKRSQQSLWM
ncbi:unnamed protein product [Parnassius apollo]|uniref:(apollo) hypothetical protein n=1 Tax=Parnassius apollo TaxID=110799 RepID=A0A8S3XW35_PARAO|nr:unnamed protein product [Parnassius apollo]